SRNAAPRGSAPRPASRLTLRPGARSARRPPRSGSQRRGSTGRGAPTNPSGCAAVPSPAPWPHHTRPERTMSAALQLPKTNMTDAEWQTRCDLAALYHVANHVGWTDLINTHMSARIPGEPNSFLINNYGEMFDEITASSLVKMDM